MKIHFKTKTARINLVSGCAWLVIAIIQTFLNVQPTWLKFIWYILALVNLLMYYQQSKPKYLIVENGLIRENWRFGKSMPLEDISTIHHLDEDYILKGKTKELKISAEKIRNDSLLKLHQKLKSLDVKWIE